ncbi:uncharacterized protein V6R79_020270 [Siganus canaliculatus]
MLFQTVLTYSFFRPLPRESRESSESGESRESRESTTVKMAAIKTLLSLLLLLHMSRAHTSSDGSMHTTLEMLFSMSPQSLASLLLMVLTLILSGSIYLWVLRYVCIGCCQPIAVGTESDVLAGMV